MGRTLGNFGRLIKHYEKARRSYPKEIFSFLKLYLPHNPLILDIGCGTGISTRQLGRLGRVIGCDPDSVMLRAARKDRLANERYVIGSADHLPFRSGAFDAVIAFAAFHWFTDAQSVAEIKRVLKPGGIIFIVNRVGTKGWGEGYRKTIINAIGREVAHFRKGSSYAPEKILKRNGIKKILVRSWKKSERYTVLGALEYVQSVSIWNSVPISLRPIALDGLKKYFERVKKTKGKIERKLTVKVVLGIK